jgi:hypothetical protein
MCLAICFDCRAGIISNALRRILPKTIYLKNNGRGLFRDIQVLIFIKYSVEFLELYRHLHHGKLHYLRDIQAASILTGKYSLWTIIHQTRCSDLLRAGWPGFNSRHGNILLHSIKAESGAHPVSYRMGTEGDFTEDKRPGREADHSSPSSDVVKNGEAIPPLPLKFSWSDA